MGRALALFLWVMTILSVWMFMSGRWWFPASISEHGPAYDRQFILTIIVVGIAFVAAQMALGYAVWRFRDTGSGERSVYTHGNNRMEIIWTAVTATIFIILALLGQRVWWNLHMNPAPAGSAQVKVLAQQFQWNFHYPGADGVFGRTNPAKISDESINYIGLDNTDPAAQDDAVTQTLILQVNRPVELTLTSRDVTHSFWVPPLRFKQDAVPGLDIKVHFTPQKTGQYEIACAELCGQQHYKMRSYMLVLPDDEYISLITLPQAQFQKRVGELVKQYPITY
ncbi:MAG: cytochrome c oxidase subunit [Acidobacteriota bacterium]|jgi:cytochrome c oxidase subunit 2|nr:cytochrome c oxidase subunit [Acidobacteriota bacterium]MDT7780464.1 cytochrome c oxidase subunit [Acidobacteriota bacterium]